jgi:hypothetical protein
MTMTPTLRKFALTAHVTSSVGWLGSVTAFLALAVAGLTSHDAQAMRSVYVSMELIGWFVIVPFSFAALLSGLVQSLGTPWGLFQHYWVLWKLVLTIGATFLLLLHMSAVSRASAVAAGTLGSIGFRALQIQLVFDASLAVLVLLATTTLSVYKPWGRTPYGERKYREERLQSSAEITSKFDRRSAATRSLTYALACIGVIFVIVVVLHLTGVVGGH